MTDSPSEADQGLDKRAFLGYCYFMFGAMPVTDSTATLLFVERHDPEWSLMWDWLGRDDVNSRCVDRQEARDPLTGESWQYMGSHFLPSGQLVHSFRHRRHPWTQQREYREVKASITWVGQQLRSARQV